MTTLHPNHISWKNKLKRTDVNITCFFQDAKPSLTKHYLLEASYGISQTYKLEIFTKNVNGL